MKNYEPLLHLFSAHLENYTKQVSGKEPKELYDPENYILSLGGKRLRPLLCLMACDLFNKDPKQALDSALCIELFHNFSLIHDDILDKAPLRRGKPTVHAKWNNEVAILSGDVMLVKAFAILNNYEAELQKKLLHVFSETAVLVCEGQQTDMNFESNKNVTVSEYIDMITNKTAVLLGGSLKMGAIIADAGKQELNHLYEFGKHLGIAFQLMDDLLDVYAEKDFGKRKGGDIIVNKKTFLLVKALETCDKKQKEKLNYFISMPAERAGEKVKGVLTIYNELAIKNVTEGEADKHSKEAIKHLHLIKADPDKKKKLEELALALLKREI